ncbi:hypothetical protein CR513_13177, partial [Mucuna pruriens]
MKQMFLEKFFLVSRTATSERRFTESVNTRGKLCMRLLMMDQKRVDAASGGALIDKTPATARNLVSNLAKLSETPNTYERSINRSPPSEIIKDPTEISWSKLSGAPKTCERSISRSSPSEITQNHTKRTIIIIKKGQVQDPTGNQVMKRKGQVTKKRALNPAESQNLRKNSKAPSLKETWPKIERPPKD